ncbi:MAG: AMP-dependent synthetase [Acidobacteria bacterium]|nr:MAG: AMP-dependent synthetase [Acidobacteriota bacterium]
MIVQIIAYVVPLGAFPEEAVRKNLQSAFPGSLLPDRYVLLSSLPFSSDGTVDEEALLRLEIVDEGLARVWEQQLLSLPGVQQAAVVIEPRVPKLKPLHISDLLPHAEAFTARESKQAFPSTSEVSVGSSSEHRRVAISHGEPLCNPQQVPATLQQALKRAAETKPVRDITYVQRDGSEVTHTYQELLEDAERILGGLRSLGLGPGDKVIFQFDRDQDFIPAFWGCVLGGFIPAPISIAPTYRELNSTISKLHHSWEMLEHPVILAGQDLASEVQGVAGLLGLENFRVETVGRLRTSAADHHWHQSQPDDVCLILLTSGSTGLPKGVLQSHRSLVHRSAGTAQSTQFDTTDVLINWFPLDHVGGIVMSHLMALFGCARQIHVPTEVILQEPLKWLDLIESHGATVTWAPNFAFGLINDREKQLQLRRWDLRSMRFILNGGEAIVPKTTRKFLQLLAKHGLRADAMHPAWGMSETCSGVAFSDRCSLETVRDEDSFVEVGMPIPSVSFRIVNGEDQPLEEGQIGRLQVAGAPVTMGYYKNPELNRECFSQDSWFNTGDLAMLNNGRLTITGRSKDMVIINGANFFSHEIESVAEEVPGVDVSYTAAFAVRVATDNTDRLSIMFHPLVPDWAQQLALIKRIREVLVKKAGVNPAWVIPVDRGDIPKTAIGKIQRSALRQRFEAGEFDSIVKRIDLDTESSRTLPNWFFRKSWIAAQPRILDWEALEGRYLVFADAGGLSDNLRREIGERALAWVEVVPGEEFARIDSSHYRLNPAEASNYELLFAALAEDRIHVDHVVHLWTYGGDSTPCTSSRELAARQYAGTYSVVYLAQILDTVHSARPVSFFLVSSQAQATCEKDLVACEKATLLGLLKTISLEMPLLECRHVDLEGNSVQTDAQSLSQELAIPKSRMEVAYRGKRRLQAALSQVDMLAQPTQPLPIAESGLYLITGGLGGIGTHLSEYLSRQYRAKLILVGRTVLPDKHQWTEGVDQDLVLARRIRNHRRLEACGVDFMYRSLDVCDLDRLRQVVSEAEEHWKQPLTGIFHLAGEGNLERHWKAMDRHWVKVESIGTFEGMFGPKVYGTWTLFELIKNRPEVLFVAFSSVLSLFGGATSSAYSAAGSFLDCYCEARRNTSHPRTYCFNWTAWDDVGMSEAGPASVAEAACHRTGSGESACPAAYGAATGPIARPFGLLHFKREFRSHP